MGYTTGALANLDKWRVSTRRLTRAATLFGPEPMLVDVQGSNFGFERGARDPELCGRAVRTGHATARAGQCAFDQFLLLVAAQAAQALASAPRPVDRSSNHVSSTASVPSQRITALWITFCSSRTLPPVVGREQIDRPMTDRCV